MGWLSRTLGGDVGRFAGGAVGERGFGGFLESASLGLIKSNSGNPFDDPLNRAKSDFEKELIIKDRERSQKDIKASQLARSLLDEELALIGGRVPQADMSKDIMGL